MTLRNEYIKVDSGVKIMVVSSINGRKNPVNFDSWGLK